LSIYIFCGATDKTKDNKFVINGLSRIGISFGKIHFQRYWKTNKILFISTQSNDDENETKSLWINELRKADSADTIYNDERFGNSNGTKCCNFGNDEYLKYEQLMGNKVQNLQIVELEHISIPGTFAHPQPIVNLQQSFTFPSLFNLKPSKEISTQTSQIDVTQNQLLSLGSRVSQVFVNRPASLPSQNIALTNLEKRAHDNNKSKKFFEEVIGDGIGLKAKAGNYEDKGNSGKPDLELSKYIPTTGVQCVMIKAKYECKD
jgi:hypothetical protein